MKRPTTTYSIIGLALLSIGVFVVHNIKDSIVGAPFSVRMVKDGSVVTEPYLPITGMAKHAAYVHINGRSVPVDTDGNFSDGVLLSPGYNVVTITQEDKFGNQKEKVVHVVAEQTTPNRDDLTIHYKSDE